MTIKLREVAVPKSLRVNFTKKSQQKSSARGSRSRFSAGHAMTLPTSWSACATSDST